MMNSMDQKEIQDDVRDRLRVLLQHRSIDLTSEDLDNLWNFLDELLSKYVDDRHLLGDTNG